MQYIRELLLYKNLVVVDQLAATIDELVSDVENQLVPWSTEWMSYHTDACYEGASGS